MEINAPFAVTVIKNEAGNGHQLQVTFSPEFRAMDSAGRADAMLTYIAELRQQAAEAEDGSREQIGMQTVLQLAEQMLPHIEADKMDVDAGIIAEIDAGPVASQPIKRQLNS